jgi:DNA-binding NarL/FixJ family response regulator
MIVSHERRSSGRAVRAGLFALLFAFLVAAVIATLPAQGASQAQPQVIRVLELTESPHIGVLVLTMIEDDDAVFAAMRAGARGYLVKGSSQSEILHAVRAVAEGEAVFGPAIARRLIEYFSTASGGPPQAFPELTHRERQVLELIARGEGNAAIARQLVLSQKTVRNHASNIFTKLQVVDRALAIVKAREAGVGVERRDA